LTSAAAGAQSITSYDYHKASRWTLLQQYWGIYFDTCLAERTEADNGHRLSIGRAISGSDFIFVHGVNDLIAPGETTAAGKVWINGKDGYDFSNVTVYDSTAFPGQKYVTIYLANGFIDQFAKANTVDVQFSQGRSKHGLQGSRDIINRLNECMDAGLQREFEAPPPAPRTPLNWTAGNSQSGQGGRFIYTKLPPVKGSTTNLPVFMGLVENGQGRFDIRLRDNEANMAKRVDIGSPNAKRFAANMLVNDAQAFAALVAYEGNSADIIDVPANDLTKLGTSGTFIIKSLDGSVPDATLTLTVDAAFGPAAITGVAPTSQALAIDALVGTYYVRGKNPNGGIYYGTAVTQLESGNLRVNWTWSNGKTDTALANLVQNVLTAVVTGYAAPAVYTIGKDRVWRGTWDNGKASEVLVPKT
jgi:hypothetical protein